MRLGILPALASLLLAVLLSACGGGGGGADAASARAFVEQIAVTPQPRQRSLAAEGARSVPALASASTSLALPSADDTLDWAELKFPTLFPKGPQSFALPFQGVDYTVRAYSTGNFLGITADGRIFGLGPFTGSALLGFGRIADYAELIVADTGQQPVFRELLVSTEEADADVGVQVLRRFQPFGITTQVHPALGGQTVYEATGTTPRGRSFKIVLLGDESQDLSAYRGPMRLQARLQQMQGQTVLAGRLVPRNAASGLNPIAFIAAGDEASFAGPAEGSVYQLRGVAEFKGRCDDDGLSGAYRLDLGGIEVTGALTGVHERGLPRACIAGAVEQAELPIALSYTAVSTHIGTVFSFQGSLSNDTSGSPTRRAVLSARGASGMPAGTQAVTQAVTQVQTAMPAQGLTLATPSLPPSTMRATARVKSNVKQLGGTSGAELVSFSATDGKLIFNRLTGSLNNLTVNDIISSVPRTNAPDGFLRKVTRIQNTNDGKVEVRTVKALAADLLDEADIVVDQPFDSTDATRASALSRGQLVYAAAQKQPASVKIEEHFNLVLYDQDGNHNTTDDQITVSGSFKVQPRVVVEFKCRRAFCSDPRFVGKFVLSEDAEVNVSAKLKKELRESKRIARIALPPITAGPLVFVPDIVLTVDVAGIVRVNVEVGARQNLDIEAGVIYDRSLYDGGFKKINEASSNITLIGPTVTGSVEAKAGIYAALRLMLFGVAGVSAEAGPYIKFDAVYPAPTGTPAWTISYGVEGNLGVDIDLLIVSKEWDIKLFDKVFRTDVAPNERPKFQEIGSKFLCDDGYSARGIAVAGGGLPPIRLYAITDDKEDGPGSGTVDWSSSLDGSLGRTRKADRHEISASLRNGTHTITAVLTDSFGNTRQREFTVQLAANRCQFPLGLPEVDITSNDNPFPLVVIDTDGALTLRARTAIGVTPLCGSDTPLTWRSSLENRNAGTSSGVLELASEGGVARQVCNHSFATVYKNQSPQTITAKLSYNGMTVSDSIDVGVLIPVPPSLGDVQFSAPGGTRYIYQGDQVSFSATGSNPVWSSSVAEDTINGRTGNNVNGRFETIGQRTIVARIDNGRGGFVSRSVTINVLSALARP